MIPITEDGVSPSDLALIHPDMMTLEDRLDSLAERARTALIQASNNNASYEEIDRLDAEVNRVWTIIDKARNFLIDIDDELSNTANSALHVDIERTNSTGITHLNIRSLEKWLAARRGAASTEAPLLTDGEHKNSGAAGKLNVSGKYKKTKGEDSLYVTLAIAVTAFAQKAGGKFLKSPVDPNRTTTADDMNMSEICTHLERLASSQNNGEKFPGQSHSSLKTTISLAFEIKRNVMKGRV